MSQHSIVHIELIATDPAVAGKFYSQLFDWKLTVDTVPMEYHMTHPEGISIGHAPVQDNMPAGDTVVYVSTDDVEATLEKAVALGGTIISPGFDIPTVGRMGVIADPTGNKVAVMKFLPRTDA